MERHSLLLLALGGTGLGALAGTLSAQSPPAVEQARDFSEQLVGTVVKPNGDGFIILEDPDSHSQKLYRRGTDTPAGWRVVRVEQDKAVVSKDGRQKVITLTSGSFSLTPSPAPLTSAIRKMAEGHFVVARTEVEKALGDLGTLVTQIRAVPHVEGETTQGFRLYAIQKGSVFDQMGLRDGDILRRVNGVEITDPATALTLYQGLASATQITIDLIRNGHVVTLTYDIHL